MFPERVRSICGAVTDFTVSSVQNVYTLSCNASWIFFTSSMILFAPIIFETERANYMESQKAQQKQVCDENVNSLLQCTIFEQQKHLGFTRPWFGSYVSAWNRKYAITTTNGLTIICFMNFSFGN